MIASGRRFCRPYGSRAKCDLGLKEQERHCAAILPRGTFEREFESMDTRLFVTSDIRAFWTLSSRPWDITKYSVRMHAVCLSVLFARVV